MQTIINNIDQLGEVLNQHHTKNILLVTSPHSYEQSGADRILLPTLQHYSVIRFKAKPNPIIDDIEKVVRLCQRHEIDSIIAIGGGSAIDTAKAARILVNAKDSLTETVRKSLPLKDPGTLFIAVPTTAGSGAEATHFAVVYIGQKKYSLSHPKALPNVVTLDPRLTYSLPPRVTAASGMDAVAQAIEAYWSVKSTEESRSYSKAALGKLLPNLERSVHDPTPESRQAMLEGAHLAGRAINIAQTTGPHALSYGFTTLHGIDHGEAVSLTLPHFMLFNSAITDDNCQDERGATFEKNSMNEIVKLLDASTMNEAAQKIADLAASIGLRPIVQIDSLSALVESVDLDRLKNNPRLITSDDIRSILTNVTVS